MTTQTQSIARALGLLTLCVLMGGLFGVIAAMVGDIPFPDMAFMVGGFVGLISAAYNLPLLLFTDLRKSLPLSFGCTAAVVAMAGIVSPLLAMLAGCYTQIVCALASLWLFKIPDLRPPWICRGCAYDMRGIPEGTPCPECGNHRHA